MSFYILIELHQDTTYNSKTCTVITLVPSYEWKASLNCFILYITTAFNSGDLTPLRMLIKSNSIKCMPSIQLIWLVSCSRIKTMPSCGFIETAKLLNYRSSQCFWYFSSCYYCSRAFQRLEITWIIWFCLLLDPWNPRYFLDIPFTQYLKDHKSENTWPVPNWNSKS